MTTTKCPREEQPGLSTARTRKSSTSRSCGSLVDEIGRGTWGIGDRIPSEDELAARFGVSKITIRQALSNLAADGYLVKVQGKGTFVAGNRPIVGLTMKTRFTDGLFGRGVQETREVVERGVVEPPAEVQRLLGIEGPIYRIATRRLAEGVPVSADESFIPPGLLPGIEDAGSRAVSRSLRRSRSAGRARSSGCARPSRSRR